MRSAQGFPSFEAVRENQVESLRFETLYWMGSRSVALESTRESEARPSRNVLRYPIIDEAWASSGLYSYDDGEGEIP